MPPITLEQISERLALADQLLAGRDTMLEPQDLPGRYGRVIQALDRLIRTLHCDALLGGGWAVWRHGYAGRVTQDVDVLIAADQVDEFQRVASVSGFDVLPHSPGRWPKLMHKETGIQVDLLPEGERPGTPAHPAPTTLPHPSALGAVSGTLRYITLDGLVQLKLAAGRARDESDVVELIRANPDQVDRIRQSLGRVHADYLVAFDRLVQRARDQLDL